MPFSLQPSLAAALGLMLARSLRMSAAIKIFACHGRRTVLVLTWRSRNPLPGMRACGLCSRGTAAAPADLLALPSQAEFLAPDAKAAIYGWEPVRY
jgi:hypothetical protein